MSRFDVEDDNEDNFSEVAVYAGGSVAGGSVAGKSIAKGSGVDVKERRSA